MLLDQSLVRATLVAMGLLLTGLPGVFAQEETPAEPDPAADPEEADEELPPLLDEKMQQIPSAAELMAGDPFDWLVCLGRALDPNREMGLDGASLYVLEVEPVQYRPHTLETLQAMRERKINPRTMTQEQQDQIRQDRLAGENIQDVILITDGPAGQEYDIPYRAVDRIIYHEDLMLIRTDELIQEGKIDEAYELLQVVDRRVPDWDKAAEYHDQLILRNAEIYRDKGDLESAMAMAVELHSRNDTYDGLSQLLGDLTERLVQPAKDALQYGRARHFLERLNELQENHPTYNKWKQLMEAESMAAFDKAIASSQANMHAQASLDAIDAAWKWPIPPARRGVWQDIVRRYQKLRVGVLRFPAIPDYPIAYPLPTEADLRHRDLTQSRLFEPSRVDGITYYDSTFFEHWEPLDLGRRVIFNLRERRPYWQSQPVLTASPIVDHFAERIDPDSPDYDERFAGYIRGFRVISPYKFEVQFSRIPFRTETVFNFPITKRQPIDEPVPDGPATWTQIVTPRFVNYPRKKEDAFNVYYRAIPEPNGMPEYHVAEVAERFYFTYEAMRQGFLRKEIDMIAHVRPQDVKPMIDSNRFFVRKYALPVTHLLQFNPNSESLKNRDVRRAIAYSIDRQKLLDETILMEPNSVHGRLTSAPFATSSYAVNPQITPRKYDLPLAFVLTVAAKKKMAQDKKQEMLDADPELAKRVADGEKIPDPEVEIPTLTMVVSPEPGAMAAAWQMTQKWKRIGINVTILPNDGTVQPVKSDEWDLMYRTYRMEEPLSELWPFMTVDDHATVDSLTHLPDWLRQQIISMDYVPSFKAAKELLQDLHRYLRDECYFVPLWEVDDYMATHRPTVSGFPEELMSTYHNVEHWIVRP